MILLKKKKGINSLWLVVLAPMGAILVSLSLKNPHLVEKLYSNGIYRYIGIFLSNVTGIFPFSLGEFIVIFTFLFILIYAIKILIKIITRHISLQNFYRHFKNAIIAISVVYFAFIILWGLNYYRLPLSKIIGLDTKPASINELKSLCINLIEETNSLRKELDLNSQNLNKDTYSQTLKRAYKGYDKVGQLYPVLDGKYGTPKAVLFSKGMSYTGITGIYFPFTAEANVNVHIPYVSIPSTATHEMAHQRGFAREDEANYIAYLACKLHPDVDFQYSGYLLALIHSMNALYSSDIEAYYELNNRYSPELKKDLIAMNEYWKRFEGPIEKASNKVNNTYLKSNNQKDGIKSYGRMVDLLIAEYREEHKK